VNPHDPRVDAVGDLSRDARSLHLADEAAHRRRPHLLGGRELAESPRTAHQHRECGQLRRRYAGERVGPACATQEVNRRGMQPIGELRLASSCATGHAVILVSNAN
jgi:hypothetical protein